MSPDVPIFDESLEPVSEASSLLPVAPEGLKQILIPVKIDYTPVHDGKAAYPALQVNGSVLIAPKAADIGREKALAVTTARIDDLTVTSSLTVAKDWNPINANPTNLTVMGTTKLAEVNLVDKDAPGQTERVYVKGGRICLGSDEVMVSGAEVTAGRVTVPSGGTVWGDGRLHIRSGETLFLLPQDGVIVGKEWGGAGSLTVEGHGTFNENVDIGGSLHGQRDLQVDGATSLNGSVNVHNDLTANGPTRCTNGLTCTGGPEVANIFGDRWIRSLDCPGGMNIQGPLESHCWIVINDAEGGQAAAGMWADGTISGRRKHFRIPHPLAPTEKKLVHATLEGPEDGVYYRGEGCLIDRQAEVTLPDYFEALTRPEGRTVHLTAKIDDAGHVPALAASAVVDGRFKVIAGDDAGASQGFYWEVKAVRADVEPLEVEESASSLPTEMARTGLRGGNNG